MRSDAKTAMTALDPDFAFSGTLVRAYRDASIFSASHRSTSERNHPPEACRWGKTPRLTHRKIVERFTPTTRRTSVVVIL